MDLENHNDIVRFAAYDALKLLRHLNAEPLMLADLERRINRPHDVAAEARKERAAKSISRSRRRRELDDYWNPLIRHWARRHVRKGALVKFKGTRDKGYREVKGWSGARIIDAQQLETRLMTQHGSEKLTHIATDSGKYLSVKELIKKEQSNAKN